MTHHTPPAGGRQQAGLLWLVASCLMLQPLATDLYLPSLPHIARHFGAAPAAVQQTLSLFVLGFALLQLVSGPLSDRFGRRPVLISGLILYALASLACVFAPTLEVLVAGRFLQAIGCCTVVVVARAMVHDIYPDAEGAHVLARISTFYALAPLLGPLLGAYLQVSHGWRAAFVVYSLAGGLLTAIAYFRLRESNGLQHRPALTPARLAGAYLRVMGQPVFWAYTLPGALSFGSIFIFLSGGSFLLINVFGVPTQYTGLFFACGAAGYMGGTLVCRKRIVRYGVRRTLQLGGRLAFLACLVYPLFVAAGLAHWSTFLLGQCLVMFAHGINFPCAQSGAVTPFPAQAGTAAALMGCLVMVAAFGLGALVGGSYNGTPYPLGILLAATGIALFASVRGLERFRSG